MFKEHFTFPSSREGVSLYVKVTRPDGPVKGIVQILHGYAEHIERYDVLMSFLSQEGYLCFGDDHLGHGRSVLEASDLSDVGSWQAADEMLADELALNAHMREFYGKHLPCTLLGHSMGSLMARALLSRHPAVCDRAIIMGTGDMPPALLHAFGLVLSFMRLFHPGSYRSPFVNELAIGSNNKAFKPARTSADWLSENPENADRYLADPLCGNPGSLYTFAALHSLMSEIGKEELIRRIPADLPILLVSGEEDAFGDFGKGPKRVLEKFNAAGLHRVRLKLYPHMRHEILQEKEASAVMQDLLDFIKESPNSESSKEDMRA